MRTIRLEPDGVDNSPAIVRALEELRESGGGTLELSPGRYPCSGGVALPDGRVRAPSVCVGGLADVAIEGRDATIVGTDIAGLFRLHDCHRVSIRGLTVDWSPLPHTSGRIVGLVPEEHAFDIEPSFPTDPLPGRIVQAILAYDPERRRLADNGWEVYQTQGERDDEPTSRTPDGHLRVRQIRSGGLPEVGWHVVVRHQVYGHNAFVFAFCSDVLLEDVTVHAVPGMAVIGHGTSDITIRRVSVVPGEGAWMSATADAMHFGACRGAVTVEDCSFAGMGDDAINIHGMYGLATARVDDRTLEVARARLHPYYDTKRGIWDAPRAGDVLEYGGGDEPLIAQGQVVVAEAHQDESRERTVVAVDAGLPPEVGEGTVLWNLSTSPAVRIRGCRVRGNRARGMLLQTRDVVLEGCEFEDVSGAGLHVCTDGQDWWESLGSREVTVRDCVFRRCNFGVARRAAALDIFSDLAGGRQSAPGVHQAIRIFGNTFEDNGGAAMHIGSSDGVEVTGNRITHETDPVIVLVNSRNVTVRDNTCVGCAAEVAVSGTSDVATIDTDRAFDPARE